MTNRLRKENIEKILVIKMRYIGDTVLTTPLAACLKKGFPHARLDILVNRGTEPVLQHHPDVDQILAFDYPLSKKRLRYGVEFAFRIRNRGYDLVIDLTNNDRSALFTFISGASVRIGYVSQHRLRRKLAYTCVVDSVLGTLHTVDHHLNMAKALGLETAEIHPFIHVAEDQMRRVEKKLAQMGVDFSKPFVVIHPGARRWYKSWPPDRFAAIGDSVIKRYGVQVLLSGSASDQSTCLTILDHMKYPSHVVNVSGQIPLAELPALIRKSVCLIGNDSAPIHIATAVNTPAVALFGATRWEDWYPRRAHDKVIAAEYPCRPCGHARKDCPLGSGYCMGSISFERVSKAVDEVLNSCL